MAGPAWVSSSNQRERSPHTNICFHGVEKKQQNGGQDHGPGYTVCWRLGGQAEEMVPAGGSGSLS